MLPHGCSTADFILNASVVTSFPLSKADSSDGHVQCTSNVKREAISSDSDGDDNVEVCLYFQRHLVHHGRFNTSFDALFVRYDTRQLCCVCCAAPLLGTALQITSNVNGDAENGSDTSNVVGKPQRSTIKRRKMKRRRIKEEKENTDDEDNVSCPDQGIDSDVVKCDIACEEAGLLGSLRKQKKADWVEQGGGFAVCNLNQLSTALRGGVQDIDDKMKLPRAAKGSFAVRVHYGTGEAVNMAVPLHSVVCFALGTEQVMAVGDSHGHIVRCKRVAPCIVNLNSKQHLSVKRNSRSYS